MSSLEVLLLKCRSKQPKLLFLRVLFIRAVQSLVNILAPAPAVKTRLLLRQGNFKEISYLKVEAGESISV